MEFDTTTQFGKVKIIMMKGEKGDTGPAGADGSSGNYSQLTNRPSINGVTVSGSQSGSYYGLADSSAIPQNVSDLTNDSGYVTSTALSTEITPYETATAEIKTSINQVATGTGYIGQPSGTLGTSDMNVNLSDNISNYAFIEIIIYHGSNTARSSQIFSTQELTAQPGGSYPPHIFWSGANTSDPTGVAVTYSTDTQLKVRLLENQSSNYVRVRGIMPVIQTALS